MINRIFVDLDDVLNSLTMPILHSYGCKVGHYEYDAFPVEVGYDVIAACDKLGGRVPYIKNIEWDGMSDDQYIYDVPSFWSGVTAADLWRTIPKSPQCDLILERAADIVGREEVFLATTPTKDPQVHADKLHWIWDNLPPWIHRQYFITPRKWLLGKPGALLIDDNLENCNYFKAEGGDAFLLPRPWNPNAPKDTTNMVNFYFDTILQRCLRV